MANNNEQLITSLQNLAATLNKMTQADNIAQQLAPFATTFKEQIAQLKTLLPQIKAENLTYEFCEETSAIAEQITDLRLMEYPIPELLAKNNLITTFNECISLLKKSLYQHSALANEKEEPLPAGDSLEAITARAEAAGRNSAAASLRSEKASKKGLAMAEELKELQRQSHDGLLDPEIMERNVRHTLIMYLQNTAAVIAADESATAIAELEALLRKA